MESKQRDGREARRGLPCPACGRTRQCLVFPTGACWCYRVESDRPKTDTSGRSAWVHLPDEERPAPQWEAAQPPDPLPSDQLAVRYEHLLRQLSLERYHREHLRKVRGLPDEAIDFYAFRSIPDPTVAKVIAAEMAERFPNDWLQIPGLVNRFGRPQLVCGRSPGLVIPCRGLDARIRAFRLRPDHTPEGSGKYRWLSGAGGPSTGSVPSWWPAPARRTELRLVEGEIKGAVLAQYLGLPCIAVPGCQDLGSRQVVDWLQLLQPDRILLTLDPDAFWKRDVGLAVDRACQVLSRLPYAFEIEVFPWD